MTIEELHIDFKRRWNKNNNSNRKYWTDLEIDQLFNTAIPIYVDIFATGRNPAQYNIGFEITQQMIDMVSTLVKSYPEQTVIPVSTTDNEVYVADFNSLTWKYRHYITAELVDSICGDIPVNIEQHHDLNSIRKDFHRKANKTFKRIPATIRDNKLYLYSDGVFNPTGVKVTYIKEPAKVSLGTYTISPTVENPNPVQIKPQIETDIPENYHHILVSIALQEAAKIYESEFQYKVNQNLINK